MQKFLFSLLLSAQLFAQGELQTLSEALGHLLGKQLEQLDMPIDLAALAKGMEDRAAGIPSPLEDEVYLQQIAQIHESNTVKLGQKNLLEAEKYLQQNKNKAAVCELIQGKLQMKILRAGNGQIANLDRSPVIRLSGRYLDGTSFLESGTETLISLDEAAPALQLGIVGMSEGEVRTLFVHPSLGFSDTQPNALQIFEVELIRADAGADEQIALDFLERRSTQ